MIEEIDEQLQKWAQALLKDASVTLSAPSTDRKGRGASLYLYKLAPAPPSRGVKQPPLQVFARYLITTWGETEEQAHQLLEALLFGAMEEAAYEVELSPLLPEAWALFGLIPQPSFALGALVKRERLQPEPQRVRRPMDVIASPMMTVSGVVLGPEDIPLPYAHVELPALQISLRTDANGRFHIPHVPAKPSTTRLRVQAKGQEQEVVVQPGTSDEEPMIIRFASFD